MEDSPRLGSTLRRVREFNRLGRLLDEVSAVNGGEALANGEEVRIARFGTFGTWSRPAGIVKLTDYRLLSAFPHEAKPLKLRKTAIDDLPRFRSESS